MLKILLLMIECLILVYFLLINEMNYLQKIERM